jgi:uncharacterized membrane protein YphA (DoxX/SURF4 family)
LNALRNPTLLRVLAFILGAVFVWASLDKIAHPDEFARIVYRYQAIGPNHELGPRWANLVAIILPWIELVTGLLLFSGFWRREAALLTALMMLVFIAAIGWALARGIDLENCGCFSVSGASREFGLWLILEDLGLLAMALLVGLVRPREPIPALPAATASPRPRD